MANPNNPFGFEQIKAEGKENRVRYYNKAAEVIYPGDALELLAAGTVGVAEAGDAIIGVAATYAASADAKVAVVDDPEAEFMVQVSGNFVEADVGQNADIVATAGDSTLRKSKHAIDTSTQATTATLQFKILGLMEKGENAVGSYAIIRVKPNQHVLKAGTTGI